MKKIKKILGYLIIACLVVGFLIIFYLVGKWPAIGIAFGVIFFVFIIGFILNWCFSS